ncbi:MAG: hypothetical protein NTW04_05465 [Elusimicrobia bacterium]|nr:hypothetical protein [Elusimicrobiota bacterium]
MDNCRLKIKFASGEEFEAEGNAQFVTSEKNRFFERIHPSQEPAPKINSAVWKNISTVSNGVIYLKTKRQGFGAGAAALMIIAAAKAGGAENLSALNLAKSLKKSGYQPQRIDRVLSSEVKNGDIIHTGAKRSRAYQITPKGMAKAFSMADKPSAT